MALEVQNIVVSYGLTEVLHGVSIHINEGELISVIGHNGAGKSTLLKSIAGILTPVEGSIKWNHNETASMQADQIVKMGISLVPEGRRIFSESTVFENIEIGAYIRRDKPEIKADIENYMTLFPILRERRNQKAGLLSGGEQQILAIVRALMSRPGLLLLDEPSLGLSPAALNAVYEVIKKIRKNGTSILLVEQNAKKALEVSDRLYVISNGRITYTGKSSELTESEVIEKAFIT